MREAALRPSTFFVLSGSRLPIPLLTWLSDSDARRGPTLRETEAEAVTYVLCAQLGIVGTEASAEYIQSYRGTSDALDASLERIRSTAQRLTAELVAIRFDVDDFHGA